MTKLLGCGLALIGLFVLAAHTQADTLSRISTSAHVPSGKAIVTGGIDPCEGILIPGGPRYAAGSVTVLRGRVTWKRIDRNSFATAFPTHVVAKVSVARNATYRFVLAPGHYVLRARFPPPSNVYPFVQVALKSGEAVHIDIPNMCM
jgi:hypothetical protein